MCSETDFTQEKSHFHPTSRIPKTMVQNFHICLRSWPTELPPPFTVCLTGRCPFFLRLPSLNPCPMTSWTSCVCHTNHQVAIWISSFVTILVCSVPASPFAGLFGGSKCSRIQSCTRKQAGCQSWSQRCNAAQ